MPRQPCRSALLLLLCMIVLGVLSRVSPMVQGVLYSHRSNFLHAMAVCLPDCLDVKSRSVILAIVPMFHANWWVAGHWRPSGA